MNQEPSKVRRLLSLVARVHLDDIDPASLAELDALLGESEAMRLLYLEAMQIAELTGSAAGHFDEPLKLTAAEQTDDDRAVLAALFDEAIRNRQTEEIREQAERALEADQAQRRAQRSRPMVQTQDGPRVIVIPRPLVYGLAAAALLLATGLFTLWSEPRTTPVPEADALVQTQPPPAPVAEPVLLGTVVSTYNDRWAGGQAIDPAMPAGEYELLDGYVQFRLTDGAEVLIQGPAQFRLDGANTMAMKRGKLFASVPPSAVGFTVDTPAARVVDIGTEFGVSAGLNDQDTHLQVYRGEVRAAPKHDGEVAGEFLSLLDEDAVAFIDDAPPVRLAFEADRYARDLETVRVRPELSDGAQWLAQAPADLRRGASESAKLQVILEQRGLLLDSDVTVDFNRYQGWPAAGFGNNRVAAGQRVDVYLLHLDTPGIQRIDGDYTIQFDRPILGVIGTSVGLNATDKMLGLPEVVYVDREDLASFSGGARGIDIDNDDDLGWIEQDGSTLRLKIGASIYTDQVRVIVQAAAETDAAQNPNQP